MDVTNEGSIVDAMCEIGPIPDLIEFAGLVPFRSDIRYVPDVPKCPAWQPRYDEERPRSKCASGDGICGSGTAAKPYRARFERRRPIRGHFRRLLPAHSELF